MAPPPTELITPDNTFSSAADSFLSTLPSNIPIDSDDLLLRAVSILGPKGSGKSALLNALFSTSFQVSANRFSPQTGTKGALASYALAGPTDPLVVVDSKGIDGRQEQTTRTDSGDASTAKVAAFVLAFSDVIIFNVWAADVGRYEAAGYGLLRSMFKQNIKLFPPEDMKQSLILFVFRDHDDGSSLDSLKKIVMHDMQQIWDSIDKPDSHSNTPLADLFDFEFASLPHMKYKFQEFSEGVAAITERFLNPSSSKPLLQPKYSKGVPLQAFGAYLRICWEDVDANKELELPSRRELVAAYRCETAFNAAHKEIVKQINRWNSDVDRGRVIPAFGTKANDFLVNILETYDTATAASAAFDVRAKKHEQLSTIMQTNIKALFQKQLSILQNQALRKFKDKLCSLVDGDGRVPHQAAQAANRDMDNWFKTKSDDLVVPALRLNTRPSRLEMQNMLTDLAARFNDSPTAQIQAMQRMERESQKPPPKARNIKTGFNLTGAMRPRGYGNLQMISNYQKGPHSFNMSVCNDADAMEQEGLGPVPLFRFQPQLHFDIDM